MTYKVYILQSDLDDTYYVGYSKEVEKRLLAHNQGLTSYTRRKKPWKLVYTESFETKSEAIKRERKLKSWKSSKALNKLINGPVV